MSSVIPILNSVPHQSFSVGLGDNVLEFTFNWVSRFSFFRVKIRDLSDGGAIIVEGASANLNVNLLRDFPDYGSAYIAGSEPTLENIGINSKLQWEAPIDG